MILNYKSTIFFLFSIWTVSHFNFFFLFYKHCQPLATELTILFTNIANVFVLISSFDHIDRWTAPPTVINFPHENPNAHVLCLVFIKFKTNFCTNIHNNNWINWSFARILYKIQHRILVLWTRNEIIRQLEKKLCLEWSEETHVYAEYDEKLYIFGCAIVCYHKTHNSSGLQSTSTFHEYLWYTN